MSPAGPTGPGVSMDQTETGAGSKGAGAEPAGWGLPIEGTDQPMEKTPPLTSFAALHLTLRWVRAQMWQTPPTTDPHSCSNNRQTVPHPRNRWQGITIGLLNVLGDGECPKMSAAVSGQRLWL